MCGPVDDNASLLLVVESDTVRESLRDWLAMVFPDLTVIEATSVEMAITLIRSQSPGVILVDVTPPEMDDARIVQALRSAGPSTKIMALMMDDHEPGRNAALSAGADACVCIWDIRTELPPKLEALLTAESQERERRTVVCIDDQLELIKLLEVVLERKGFDLVGAVSGSQGVEIVRRVKPDLVLLDVMMPRMDGREVYRQIRAHSDTRDIPIILLTVMSPISDRTRGLDVEGYVRKPFHPQELLSKINDVIGAEG